MIRLPLLIVLAVAIAGCTAQGPSLNLQAEQMERVLLDCKDRLGFAGQTRTSVTFDGGVAQASVVPFDQITAADAAQINACAGGVDVLDDGVVVVPLQSAAVEPAIAPVSVIVEQENAPLGTSGCSKDHAPLYGGTSYCVGGYR